ncbi:MAG: AAA family ATPase [Candidatus Omnitrophica bacterium]|nr:AAA family ATPase [Candidatus Omnitrophota bacterium]
MSNTQLLTEKYRPGKLKEILGSPKNIGIIREWADSFKGGGKPHFPAILLVGPPGIGKTSAAHAMAEDYHWPITEFNASDIRTYDALMEEVGPLVLTRTLKAGIFRKLVLLDEVDSLYDAEGKVSANAPDAIIKILNFTKHPIVMTCNDEYKVHPKIKDMCVIVKWRKMTEGTIRKVLLQILKKENQTFPIEHVNTCIVKGDLRASINSIEVLIVSNLPTSQKSDLKLSPFDFVREVFTCTDMYRLRRISENNEMKPDDTMMWISENVTLFYRGIEVVKAYEQLSIADLYLQEARMTGDYQYWKLAYRHMIMGVALCRKRKVNDKGYIKVRNPSWFKKMKETKYQRRTIWAKGALAQKLGKMFNMSAHSMMSSTFPLIQKLCIDSPVHMLELKLLLDLNEHEIAAILDTSTLDPRIAKFMNPDLKISDETQAIIERHQNKQKPVLSFFRFKGQEKKA